MKSPRPGDAPRVFLRLLVLIFRTIFAVTVAVMTTLIFTLVVLVVLIHENPVQLPKWSTEYVSDKLIQSALNVDMTEARVSISLNTKWRPQLSFDGLSVQNMIGEDTIRLNRLDSVFSLKQALMGKLDISEIYLDGLSLSVFRGKAGDLTAQLGATNGTMGSVTSPAQLKAQLDAVFVLPALASFRVLDVQNVIFDYQDAKAQQSWILDGGRLSISKEDEALSIRSDFALLSGGSDVSLIEANFQTEIGHSASAFGIKFIDLPTTALASQSAGFAWLGALDAPISGAIRGRFDQNGTLESIIATLDIAEGALSPSPASKPLEFSSLKTYFTYIPAQQLLSFDNVTLQSADVNFSGEGTAFVETNDLFKSSLVGQFRLNTITANPRGFFDEAKSLDTANLEFRLLLDPFEVQLKHFYAADKARALNVRGQAEFSIDESGWSVALKAMLDHLNYEGLMHYWPNAFKAPQRRWVDANVAEVMLSDIVYNLRYDAENALLTSLSFAFKDADFSPIKDFPSVQGGSGIFSSFNRRLAISLQGGTINTPKLGAMNIGGTDFMVPNTKMKPSQATVNLKVRGSLQNMFGLINEKPLSVFARIGKDIPSADGVLDMTAELAFPMKENLTIDDVAYQAKGSIVDFQMPDTERMSAISGPLIAFSVNPEVLELMGDFQTLGLELDGQFRFDIKKQKSRLNAEFQIDRALINTLSLPIPEKMLKGSSVAKLSLNLPKDGNPRFEIRSDLFETKLSFNELNWQKPMFSSGELVASGTLDDGLKFDGIFLAADGLVLSGRPFAGAEQGLGQFVFDTFKVDQRIDVAGRLDLSKGLAIQKGYFDARPYFFGEQKRGARTDRLPANIILDRVRVTKKLYLNNFNGDIILGKGISGNFTAGLGPHARITGSLIPLRNRTSVELLSDQGGAILKEFGVVKGANGGKLRLTLTPAKDGTSTDAYLKVENVKIQGAPFLAELLNAISIVGLLEQLTGPGILLNEIEANFRIKKNQIILKDFTVFGPSMGITMNGYFNLKTKVLDMQGVISPIYVINGVGSLVSQKGEGLIGFNFKLKGPSDTALLSVNPLSVLTPAIFRNIFRRPPPNYNE